MVKIEEIANGVYARIVEGLTNSGIIVGSSEIMVIDSLRVPSHARQLIDDVKRISDKPIKYLIDTHSHWDHSWGNEEFLNSTIIGHSNCYKEMTDSSWNKQWLDKIVSAKDPWSKEAEIVNITPPNMTFNDQMTLFLDDRKIDLKYFGKAHTSGDIFIHLPKENILFTGDVIQNKGIPFFGDSYPSDWMETSRKILNTKPTTFVAGHGKIGTYSDMIDANNFVDEIINDCFQLKNKQPDQKLIAKYKEKYSGWRKIEMIESSVLELVSRL